MTHFHLDHPPHDSDAAWQRLVNRLAASIDDLVREYVDELVGSRIYSGVDLSQNDMIEAASLIFRIFAKQLSGQDDGQKAIEAARMLGRSRAQRGVSLEALVFAIQLDFPLFWRRLVVLAGPDDQQALIDHVDLLHRVIDNYVLAARDEFLKEKSRISRDRTIIARQYLGRLFGETEISGFELENIAVELGIEHNESLTLAVAHPSAARALQSVTESFQEAGECFGSPLGRTSCVFWRTVETRVQESIEQSGLSVALYAPAHGLTDIRSAAQGADALIAGLDENAGIVAAEDLLPSAFGAAIDSYMPGLRTQLMKNVEMLADDERDRLIRTVEIYLLTGSTKQSARQVSCHRNTVINRLNHFEQLTGLDVTIGRDAALSLMLLSAATTR
ncbi:helix-turn-helix domain-containing protein [Brevibacterium casei]|uniref:helix-turn-helix domain-containing protein n=1 Tax=Brevibacterium casei TaxID=33889 RepID=UPI00223BEEC4|nr:helix-turn-helix domain-containing protein [Brevibacterium casei]MCT1549256.1 helix-turn-helix domain-containing protein [Brevibacterium casei]MCT1560776.1 helix-turn-helix domain-containing protein [Brevibacterium casei]MCT2207735.1 helix-turn-helix domain-containing protein [Brevibacterium casei]